MVLTVNRESITPDEIVTPILAVTKPKEIKTIGEQINKITNHIENLFSPLAQIALIEFVETAINTAAAIYSQLINNLLIFRL